MSIFTKDGRLMIPISLRKRGNKKRDENKVRYIINHAYCPKGCSVIDPEIKINGFPGLRIGFQRPGMKGEFVISAIEGDFDKKVLSGELIEGVKDELFCPHCGTPFEKLVNCNCQPGADMVVIGLTPKLNFNHAITFCNVTGCSNGSFIQSGDALRHVRLHASL
ncbi:MAG TPA: hypothetical protein PLK12_12275 [Prolixibacteraceae bacterium]|nr:hypothetical protein [Prolixibacteraceae bacterium]